MSVAQSVQNSIEFIPVGVVFGYKDLPEYRESAAAVVKAISRLVQSKKLERLSKGKFYVPKVGLLGTRKPSDSELIWSETFDGGRRFGYVTGLSLYNQLGLTTQVPKTVTIAVNGGWQKKDFGTIRVKRVTTRAPIEEGTVKLLQYLDVLKGIKLILDADINLSLRIMRRKLSELSEGEKVALIDLAVKYYSPQVRALLGLLTDSLTAVDLVELKLSLNPTTVYKLNLDEKEWPAAREWNIR